MKMRKILATLAAAVVACTAMVTSAFAAEHNNVLTGEQNMNGYANIWNVEKDEIVLSTEVDGVKYALVGDNSEKVGVHFTKDGATENITSVKYDLTLTGTATAYWSAQFANYEANIVTALKEGANSFEIKPADAANGVGMCNVGFVCTADDGSGSIPDGATLTVNKITINGVEFTVPAVGGGEESKTDSTTDSTESTASSSTAPATDKNEPTGATAGLALAGLAIAGAAVVASKKSK